MIQSNMAFGCREQWMESCRVVASSSSSCVSTCCSSVTYLSTACIFHRPIVVFIPGFVSMVSIRTSWPYYAASVVSIGRPILEDHDHSYRQNGLTRQGFLKIFEPISKLGEQTLTLISPRHAFSQSSFDTNTHTLSCMNMQYHLIPGTFF